AKFELTTVDDCCDLIVRLQFNRVAFYAARGCPCLRQLEDAIEKKSKIECDQRKPKCLIQQKCRRQCGCGARKVWHRFLRERRNTFRDERHCRNCLSGSDEQRLR